MTRRRTAPLRSLTEDERWHLTRLARATAAPAAHVARTNIRFNRDGLAALDPRHAGGHTPTYDAAARDRILREAARTLTPDTDGTGTWSLPLSQRALQSAPGGLPKVSTYTIWRARREAGYAPAPTEQPASATWDDAPTHLTAVPDIRPDTVTAYTKSVSSVRKVHPSLTGPAAATLKSVVGPVWVWESAAVSCPKYRPARKDPHADGCSPASWQHTIQNLFREFNESRPGAARQRPHDLRARAMTAAAELYGSADKVARVTGCDVLTARHCIDGLAFEEPDDAERLHAELTPRRAGPTFEV